MIAFNGQHSFKEAFKLTEVKAVVRVVQSLLSADLK